MSHAAPSANGDFDALCQHARETALLASIEELLGWDERTKLPPAAGTYRADQMTYLAGMIHRRRTDLRLGELLAKLAESDRARDPHSDAGATIRQLRRRYEKNVKLPQSLVEAMTRATVLGQQAWAAARPKNDFAAFRPHVAEIMRLAREKADAVGYPECPYDALLDDYEPEALTSEVARVLAGLRADLVPLVESIVGSSRRADDTIFKRHYPIPAQETFSRGVCERIGFEFSRGRLDVTAHPFCTTVGPDDCRITRFLGRCTKRATACTSRDCAPSGMAFRRAKQFRSAFTSRNRECGRTSSAAVGRFGSSSIRRHSGLSPRRSAICRWTRFISP
jgi:carboxypeptidase Taq